MSFDGKLDGSDTPVKGDISGSTVAVTSDDRQGGSTMKYFANKRS